jgi:hypothetical protein
MKIYYYANSIYQFAYALPVYRRLGGTFIVRSYKKYMHFKRYMKNLAGFGEKNFYNTPDVILKKRSELNTLSGILFFLCNSIKPEHKYTKCITIFHEHGTSDKKYCGGLPIGGHKLSKYDYILLSGQKNRERFNDIGLNIDENKLIRIGGLRFDDFINGKINREKEMDRLGIKDRTRKNILYAPTWRFGNGTLRKYAGKFAREITKEHNLIVRPHNHDRKYGALICSILKVKGVKHLYYSNPINLIKNDTFADFAASDLMISDISSVIYEYLITGNPMIIVKNDFKQRHSMPNEMNIMSHVDIFDGSQDILSMINENLKNHKYKDYYKILLNNCFYSTDGHCGDRAVSFFKSLKENYYEK